MITNVLYKKDYIGFFMDSLPGPVASQG